MTKERRSLLLCAVLLAACLLTTLIPAGGSDIYPPPSKWSLGDLASWTQPLIASGTSLPLVASGATGDLFILVDGASATLYRLQAGAWATMSSGVSGGTGSGVATHSDLANLAYADAGHTGFASTTSILNVRAEMATVSLSVATVAGDLSAHAADQTDPHGATMTISTELRVGSGTADTSIERTGTGTVTISSYTRIVPETATPTGVIATGTLWYDANAGKLKCYDGSAWQALW